MNDDHYLRKEENSRAPGCQLPYIPICPALLPCGKRGLRAGSADDLGTRSAGADAFIRAPCSTPGRADAISREFALSLKSQNPTHGIASHVVCRRAGRPGSRTSKHPTSRIASDQARLSVRDPGNALRSYLEKPVTGPAQSVPGINGAKGGTAPHAPSYNCPGRAEGEQRGASWPGGYASIEGAQPSLNHLA